MNLENVLIFNDKGEFENASVKVEDGRFVEISSAGTGGEEYYMIPGLIDMHFHGCMGADFSDGDVAGLEKMAEYEASVGVTSICPASMSISRAELARAMKAACVFGDGASVTRSAHCFGDGASVTRSAHCFGDGASVIRSAHCQGSRFVGINMEGPFINPEKKGAQKLDNIVPPDVDFFREMQELSGNRIKLVDIAPEMEGAISFIREISPDTVVSVAHTLADYETASVAFKAGASHVTHLYNAMPAFTHRMPGVVGAAADASDVTVELICDGVHIHPSVIRSTFKLFGRDRVIMISDSMRATGMPDGVYTLGGQEVNVKGNKALLLDGTLAGSATNLMDCLRFTVKEAGISLEDAVRAASMNPAKKLGIFDEVGSISIGKLADYVLIDKELNIVKVVINGEPV